MVGTPKTLLNRVVVDVKLPKMGIARNITRLEIGSPPGPDERKERGYRTMTTQTEKTPAKEFSQVVDRIASNCGLTSERVLMTYATVRTQTGVGVDRAKYQADLEYYVQGLNELAGSNIYECSSGRIKEVW
jgi:hypothetical protein